MLLRNFPKTSERRPPLPARPPLRPLRPIRAGPLLRPLQVGRQRPGAGHPGPQAPGVRPRRVGPGGAGEQPGAVPGGRRLPRRGVLPGQLETVERSV